MHDEPQIDSLHTPYTLKARARYEAGQTRPRSRRWHAFMATRLNVAAAAHAWHGHDELAASCRDRARESQMIANRMSAGAL